mmetsp:Transcript_3580/g.10782  ORF Transcript_3580/g.10782 Transcript_3580/m.10782 type:complete len:423 (-) Transcript_3580:175-1443(-)
MAFIVGGVRNSATDRRGSRSALCRRRTTTVMMAGSGSKKNPYRITVLRGDGSGPEMAGVAVNILEAIADYTDLHFDIDWAEFGDDALEKTGSLVPEETVEKCRKSDAVLKSYQGNRKDVPPEENAHIILRKELNVFAQVTPFRVYPQISSMSVFDSQKVDGMDVLLAREISGGVLREREMGLPKIEAIDKVESFMRYEKEQVARFASLVLSLAEQRSGKIVNVDRADQLTVSKFWREQLHATIEQQLQNRNDVILEDMFVDDFCRATVIDPKQFDVICTSNLFGDIVSELLASIPGPARIWPMSWFAVDGLSVHGPADIYNAAAYRESQEESFTRGPIAMIRAVSMLLRYGVDEPAAADLLQQALMRTLDESITQRLAKYIEPKDLRGRKVVSVSAFTESIISSLQYMRQFEMVCDPVECGE